MAGKKSEYSKLKFGKIARRYFVLNGFDGILTVLGISVGAFVARVSDPAILISSGTGTAVGLLVSGVTGAYVTEKAERTGDLKELKKSMISNMEGSVHEKNVSKQSAFIATVNGLSPLLCAFLIMIPYMLSQFGVIKMLNTAYFASMTVSGVLLVVFGSFLGNISKESKIKYSLKMLLAGLVTAILSMILGVAGI